MTSVELLLASQTKAGYALSMRRVRSALLGAGFIAGVHARSIRLAGGELVGVAAATPQQALESARLFGAERAFESAEEAISADDVDVIHICAPNSLHAPLALRAMNAGKHVICEKPMALDGAQAEDLFQVAKQADTVAAVPFVYRYYPLVIEARDRLASGKSGNVHLLHGSYLQDWLLTDNDDNWRTDSAIGGPSRAFADIGSHWCDLATFMTGDPITRVMARTVTAIPQRHRATGRHAFVEAAEHGELVDIDTEDAALVLFETVSGAVGSTIVSQVSAGRKNRLWIEIDASHEALVFNQEEPEWLWCGTRESARLIPRAPEALGAAAQPFVTLPGGHPQGFADCFAAFIADVFCAVKGGDTSSVLPSFADGLAAARLTDAVLESSESGRWTDVAAATASQPIGGGSRNGREGAG